MYLLLQGASPLLILEVIVAINSYFGTVEIADLVFPCIGNAVVVAREPNEIAYMVHTENIAPIRSCLEIWLLQEENHTRYQKLLNRNLGFSGLVKKLESNHGIVLIFSDYQHPGNTTRFCANAQ